MNQTFSGVTTLASPASGQRIGYPAFLPDDSGLLFETETRTSTSDSVMVTRNGARSELWWVNSTGTAMPTALANLNGKGYLPLGPNNHGAGTTSDPQDSYSESGLDDTTLDYEPTVLPVAAGGYAWVVFTSRRMYGSELQSTPWLSWPPDYDTTSLAQATVKKLWVAAIDLNAPAGTDPSHPAFYLPAQELLAGNSRGFWVLDPCKHERRELPVRRPVLQRLLRAERGRRGARLLEHAAELLGGVGQVHDRGGLLRHDEQVHQRVLRAAGGAVTAAQRSLFAIRDGLQERVEAVEIFPEGHPQRQRVESKCVELHGLERDGVGVPEEVTERQQAPEQRERRAREYRGTYTLDVERHGLEQGAVGVRSLGQASLQHAGEPRKRCLDCTERVVQSHRGLGQAAGRRGGEVDLGQLLEPPLERASVGGDLRAQAMDRRAHRPRPSAAMRSRSDGGASSRRTRSTVHPSAAVTSAKAAK